MNLNDFMALPNNKARSVKFNARNLREVQMETVTLALQSSDMEEKLRQLKQSMSKEKKERGNSGGPRWKWSAALNNNASSNVTKMESTLQKQLSAGKVKIRMLKDEPPKVQPRPPFQPPVTGLRAKRKNRLMGTVCGQCEVKSAGLRCLECAEHYCVACFAKFHQRGALKLHRMIPIKTELHTHVSTRDVANYCPGSNADPWSKAVTGPIYSTDANTREEEEEEQTVTEPTEPKTDSTHVLGLDPAAEEGHEERELPFSLLQGEYNEEESASSFQEALRQWRGKKETGSEARDHRCEEAQVWIPDCPVSVSATATQADLTPDRANEGQGKGAGGRKGLPIRVEFTEHSLSYMDRLLLKKHRRTPLEFCHPPLVSGPALDPPPVSDIEEESSVTAQKEEAEEFRHYCASLFAVPVSGGEIRQAQLTTPESCLVIQDLDETDRGANGVSAERKTNSNTEVPLFQSGIERPVLPTVVPNGGPSGANHLPPSAARRLQPPTPQTSIPDNSSPLKKMLLDRPRAETPRIPLTSIKTPTPKSPEPRCSPTVHKSKAEQGSAPCLSSLPRWPAETPKSSCSLLLLPPTASLLHPSSSPSATLRSTYDVSPSNSTTTQSQASHSSEQPETISSLMLSQLTLSNLEQSQHPLHDQPLPPSSSPNHFEPCRSQTLSEPLDATSRSPLSPFNESPPDANPRYESTYGDAPVLTSYSCLSGKSASHQDKQYIPTPLSKPLNAIQNHPFHVRVKDEDDLSVDSGDEMSTDSLGLALSSEEDSSDDEGHLTRGRFREDDGGEEEQGDSVTSCLRMSFVPTDADTHKDLPADEPEQLPEPSMENWSSGAGSEQSYDPDAPLTQQYSNSMVSPAKRLLPSSPQFPPPTQSRQTPASRPLSQAAQEIMAICGPDQSGGGDPNLERDTHMLHRLKEELRLMTAGRQLSLLDAVNSGRRSEQLTRVTSNEEQGEDEEAAERDRQSVLSLP